MIAVTTKLPDDLAARLDAAAEARGTTRSRLARDLIHRGLVPGEALAMVGASPPRPKPAKPGRCPDHPDAGRLLSDGKIYCDAPLCRFVYSAK